MWYEEYGIIKPFFGNASVCILKGDCKEILPLLPDNSMHLALTDPPYGITKQAWDIIPSKQCFDEILRCSRNQIIFGGQFFDLPKKEGWIIWYKRPFLKTTNEAELLWTSFDIKTKVIDYTYAGNYEGFSNGNLRPDYKKRKIHFTSEKPVGLVKYLMEIFTQEGEIILDPFLGSGTTAYCAKKLNRHCIGIEINERRCEIAANRCSQQVSGFRT